MKKEAILFFIFSFSRFFFSPLLSTSLFIFRAREGCTHAPLARAQSHGSGGANAPPTRSASRIEGVWGSLGGQVGMWAGRRERARGVLIVRDDDAHSAEEEWTRAKWTCRFANCNFALFSVFRIVDI